MFLGFYEIFFFSLGHSWLPSFLFELAIVSWECTLQGLLGLTVHSRFLVLINSVEELELSKKGGLFSLFGCY